ncbi:hypothetical protein BH09PAT4_BH09PAT4_01190 [soil metagenome]
MPHNQDPQSMAIAQNLQNPEQYGDYLRSQADFLQNLTGLMEALRATREPDRIQYDFEYFINEPGNIELPSSMTLYCGHDLRHATVTLVKEAEQEPLISLQLQFKNERTDKALWLYVSRDPTLQNPQDKDAVLIEDDPEPIPIDRIPKADVNGVVLGLALGTVVHDHEGLERANLLSGDSYEVLLDILQKSAPSWQSSVQYSFDDERRMLDWSINSFGNGESIATCRFTYETSNPDHTIAVDIDPRLGLALEFTQRGADGNAHPMSPDTGDILRLQEVIAEIATRYNTTKIIPVDPIEFADERVIEGTRPYDDMQRGKEYDENELTVALNELDDNFELGEEELHDET